MTKRETSGEQKTPRYRGKKGGNVGGRGSRARSNDSIAARARRSIRRSGGHDIGLSGNPGTVRSVGLGIMPRIQPKPTAKAITASPYPSVRPVEIKSSPGTGKYQPNLTAGAKRNPAKGSRKRVKNPKR